MEAVYGGFWRRLVAYVIDITIVSLVQGAVSWIMYHQDWYAISIWPYLVPAIVAWLYFALGESSTWQATIGKRMLGVHVADENGNSISFLRASVRWICKIFSGLLLGIGYLMILFSVRKRGLHDVLAGTLVLRSHSRPAARFVHVPATLPGEDYWDGSQWVKR
jgi:uncharacterized RDD family membrane protein YckC